MKDKNIKGLVILILPLIICAVAYFSFQIKYPGSFMQMERLPIWQKNLFSSLVLYPTLSICVLEGNNHTACSP